MSGHACVLTKGVFNAQEEAKAAKEQESSSGDNNVAQKAPAIITVAPVQANHVSQPNDKGGLAMPATSAAPQVGALMGPCDLPEGIWCSLTSSGFCQV